ncbi:MAG: carboxypeptidase regulatory-like domain-containing protein [Acidobacteriota bacterium]
MKFRFGVLCLQALGSCVLLLGQAQTNTGDLVGVVKDQTDAVLPGADISLRNLQTGLTRTTVSDDVGGYRLPLLPPGEYELRAELPGFSTKVYPRITVSVGAAANLDILLAPSGGRTEIVVQNNVAIVEKEKTVQSSTISQMEIQNLPINGRNFLDFTLLTPGVTDRHTLASADPVQLPTSGLSFGGQDQRSNGVTIDGADNIDVISNSVRSTLSQEAIQEFQVNRNTFNAELGRARGGVINIVSKSGTNKFHGSGFFFIRDDSLDARNTFARGPEDPLFERRQFGGTLGGPIVQDRTFFFGSYEGLDRNESLFVSFLDDDTIFKPTPSQRELFGFLASTGIPSLRFLSAAFVDPNFGVLETSKNTFPATIDLFQRESGVFPFSADSNTFSIKIDHQVSQTNQMFFRFNYTDSFTDNANFGALEGVSNGVKFDIQDLAFVFSDTHIFNPNTLNEFKFQFGRRQFAVPTNDPDGPEIVISGVAKFGREFFNPTGYDEKIFQFTDNFTFIRGQHTFKTGGDLNIVDLNGFARVFLGGQFTFAEAIPLGLAMDKLLGPGTTSGLTSQLARPASIGGLGRPDLVPNLLDPLTAVQAFNFGLPITYFQGFGDPEAAFTYYQVALYFQDTWKLKKNFTLNLGVRYDTDFKPATLNVVSTESPFQLASAALNDRNNFAPRVGFAWDPWNNGKMVIRGGYGIFYQNFFQAIAFVSNVLAGKISQIFLPITGLPGITDVTSSDVFQYIQKTGASGQEAAQFFGVTPGETPSVILPGAGDAISSYSHQASFGIERSLGADWAISLDYILNRGVHLIRSRDINVRQVGTNEFAIPGLDPDFVQLNLIETSGSSIYHGFTAALRKRFSQNYSMNVSYTLGKAIDDTTDFLLEFEPANQTDVRSERSLSTFDQRQRLVVSGIYQSPYRASRSNGWRKNLFADWVVAPIVTAASGKPFNLLLGFDANGDTHEALDRPCILTDQASSCTVSGGTLAGRNTGKGDDLFTTDLRLSRKFRLPREQTYLEFIFEAFNLFNKVNYSGVNFFVPGVDLTDPVVRGSEDIPANQPLGFTSAFDPRQIQFGLRFVF